MKTTTKTKRCICQCGNEHEIDEVLICDDCGADIQEDINGIAYCAYCFEGIDPSIYQ